MEEEKYLTHKELIIIISAGLAGVALFYSPIKMLYITMILGVAYGALLSFQLHRINRVRKISVRELIIYMNLLAAPFIVITYIVAYFKDFRIAILFISFALLSSGLFLLFARWRRFAG